MVSHAHLPCVPFLSDYRYLYSLEFTESHTPPLMSYVSVRGLDPLLPEESQDPPTRTLVHKVGYDKRSVLGPTPRLLPSFSSVTSDSVVAGARARHRLTLWMRYLLFPVSILAATLATAQRMPLQLPHRATHIPPLLEIHYKRADHRTGSRGAQRETHIAVR